MLPKLTEIKVRVRKGEKGKRGRGRHKDGGEREEGRGQEIVKR